MSQRSFLPGGDVPHQPKLFGSVSAIDPSVWLVPEHHATLRQLIDRVPECSQTTQVVTLTTTTLPADMRSLRDARGAMTVGRLKLRSGDVCSTFYTILGLTDRKLPIGTTTCLLMADFRTEITRTIAADTTFIDRMMERCSAADSRYAHAQHVSRVREEASPLSEQIDSLTEQLATNEAAVAALRCHIRSMVSITAEYNALDAELLTTIREGDRIMIARRKLRESHYRVMERAITHPGEDTTPVDVIEQWEHVATVFWTLRRQQS